MSEEDEGAEARSFYVLLHGHLRVVKLTPAGQQVVVRFVAPGGYSPVEMDPRRVRRVVRNLLGNAIEHGEGRPIVITVDSDQQAVAIGVRDFGLGMRPEDV